ncbi:MAG: FTR1 family protein [Chloroflexi bacterium]|nr:FTR1 family protein [Chloroflexota bacterium]
MIRSLLRTFLPVLGIAALVAAVLAPSVVVAQDVGQTPAQQLAHLAQYIDDASARLTAGDIPGARSAYQAFADGWPKIEDGIRAQSRDAYRAIEDAMGDARYAINVSPFDPAPASAALSRLKNEAQDFIEGRSMAQSAPASSGKVTVQTLVGRLDRATADLNAGRAADAAAEISGFRRDWLEVEVLIKGKSQGVYIGTENNMAVAAAQLGGDRPDIDGARAIIQRMKTDLEPYAGADLRYTTYDAMIIILREGLEALLVVAALLTFLKRSGNADKTRWIWGGGAIGVLASMVVAVITDDRGDRSEQPVFARADRLLGRLSRGRGDCDFLHRNRPLDLDRQSARGYWNRTWRARRHWRSGVALWRSPAHPAILSCGGPARLLPRVQVYRHRRPRTPGCGQGCCHPWLASANKRRLRALPHLGDYCAADRPRGGGAALLPGTPATAVALPPTSRASRHIYGWRWRGTASGFRLTA